MHRAKGNGIVMQQRREMGYLIPRAFASLYDASEDLIRRFSIHNKLAKHTGDVNIVRYNAGGDILISGADDLKIILWDWDANRVKVSFHSGHKGYILDACFIPFTDDCTIVTTGYDGQVRRALILEDGNVITTPLADHGNIATRLAVEPRNPHVFYCCGCEGLVQCIDLRIQNANNLFICSNMLGFVPLNSIAIDPQNEYQFAIGGEDKYIRVYDIRTLQCDRNYPINYFCPAHLIDYKNCEIKGLAFSYGSELLASYSKEIYLFSKDQGLGQNSVNESINGFFESNSSYPRPNNFFESDSLYPWPDDEDQMIGDPQAYKGYSRVEKITSVSFIGPNCEYVSGSSDKGQIFIWRKRDDKLLHKLKGDQSFIRRIAYHPYVVAIASCGGDNDIEIWTPNATEPTSD